MFHNSFNVKMFANMYRKCWFADELLKAVFGMLVSAYLPPTYLTYYVTGMASVR